MVIQTSRKRFRAGSFQAPDMRNRTESCALLPLIGVLLLWTCVSSTPHSVDGGSRSGGQGEELPRVVKRSTESCNSTFDNYCLNNGQCMLLVDINEHHCKCDRGFYGHRCADMEFVTQPMAETQIIVAVFCVCLLLVGLAGTLYFCCKWYKNNSFSSQHKRGSRGVQSV